MAKAKAAKAAKDGDAGPGEGGPKKGGRKKLVLIAAPVLLLGAGAGLWFSGLLPGWLGSSGAAHAEAPAAAAGDGHGGAQAGSHGGGHGAGGQGAATASAPAAPRGPPVFVDMPDLTTNLNVPGRRPTYLRLRSRLELARAEDAAALQQAMPRVLDLFQTYLREMRPDELRGSAGTQRLKEELAARASLAAHPARVVDVLFTEILVQ